MKLIDKDTLVVEINKRITDAPINNIGHQRVWAYNDVKEIIDTLEVIDPYEQWVQYSSIEAGIKAHAEDYSFNIESELFNQLTKEQQALWRKEIEEACISGGYAGYTLAKDPRYEENHEVKEVDLKSNSFDATVCKIGSTYLKEMDKDAIIKALEPYKDGDKVKVIIKAQKGE